MSTKKRSSKQVVPRQSTPEVVWDDENVVIPKGEFVQDYVDPEEAEAYWVALCNMITPPKERRIPPGLKIK